MDITNMSAEQRKEELTRLVEATKAAKAAAKAAKAEVAACKAADRKSTRLNSSHWNKSR